jgi:uncharacterized membrane protein YfcA
VNTVLEACLVFIAGVAAGTINTVVGSGTLITFPVLLSLGLSPLTANVTNTLGLVPGSFMGAYGYRDRLTGQRALVLRLGSGPAGECLQGHRSGPHRAGPGSGRRRPGDQPTAGQ